MPKKLYAMPRHNSMGVQFYTSILKKKNPANHFFPILRLIGHRNVASTFVKGLARNTKELKEFFIFNKDIFIVNDKMVKLVDHTVYDSARDCALPKVQAKEINKSCQDDLVGVEFYFTVLVVKRRSVPLVELIEHTSGASSEIRSLAENIGQLKIFLCKYPNVFHIKNDIVHLSSFITDLLNSITCILSILIDKYTKEDVSMEKLMLVCKSEFKSFKLDDVNHFKELLYKYDNMFKLIGNLVSIDPTFISNVKSAVSTHLRWRATTSLVITQIISKAIIQKEITFTNNCVVLPKQLSYTTDSIAFKSNDRHSPLLQPPNKSEISPQQYFVEKLLNCGFCNTLSIDELFELKLQAPSHVQFESGNNIKDFKYFLCCYPECFCVTDGNVMAKSNIPRKELCSPLGEIEEPKRSLLAYFFKSKTLDGRIVGIEEFYQSVGKDFFESAENLESFLKMFPHMFHVYNSKFVNLMCVHKEYKMPIDNHEYTRMKNAAICVIKINCVNANPTEWKQTVFKNTELVTAFGKCQVICNHLLENAKVIALGCERMFLGVSGNLSLIQIATEDGKVFIFYASVCQDLMALRKLKAVLVSPNILKVIHDSRKVIADLYRQFDVVVHPVFDTKVAHGFITNPYQSLNKYPDIGINKLCCMYGAPGNMENDLLIEIYKRNPSLWSKRPLNDDMIIYAALAVASLVPHLYKTLKTILDDLLVKVLHLSECYSREYI